MNDLINIALVLTGAKLGGEATKRFGQPVILGELLAGIVLGGSFLGILERTPVLDTLSDLGIILLLFLAGLEINIEKMKEVGKVVMVDSIFDVVFAFILGYIIGLAFGMPTLTALFLGGILTATSVGITTRTLMDLGKLNTKAGTTILGVAVMDDIQGIFILSILAGLATTNQLLSVTEFLTLLFMIIGFFTISLLLVPKLVTIAAGLIDKMWVDEAPMALTISFILILSFIAKEIGLAYIVGAFMAGVTLNLGVKYKENVSTKFNTITYGFLAPFFFVEIGLRTDISAILQTGFLLTLAIIVAAAVGKISGCTLGSLIMGYDRRDAFRVGIGMLPRAEVALITAEIGLTAGVIPPNVFSSIVVMVLVLALSTPLLLRAVFEEPDATPS
ncbi:MAG TPA: cation:proton antiporter [Euryarchaeota archaeon]|nr:high-affinity Na(+)/H(+) antiporter NhaS3 [archaeon BMS3Abin16]GBE56363.1 high-affinity Na(+)/H(+) antiporter NhaS3 [archaeon BMS3Bbin16]HDH27994.1 cation:proton antiporter [Euryarchaeota archaeon]